jgi:nucleotide-binding universal stress UspA family protein
LTLRVLVAVDGSAYGIAAIDHVLKLAASGCDHDIQLLTVQIPLDTGHVRRFIARDSLEAHYRDAGNQALAGAIARVQEAGTRCTPHIAVGHIAHTINHYAAELAVDLLVIGTHGRTGLSKAVMGSVATEVIRQATVPVTVVKLGKEKLGKEKLGKENLGKE